MSENNDKFAKYYPLIDCHKIKYNIPDDSENDTDDVILFKLDCPLVIDGLVKYLYLIINDMCKKLQSRVNVEREIQKIKYYPNDPSVRRYKYNDNYLVDFYHADYNYLKKKYIIKSTLVPDEKTFNDIFVHKYVPDVTYSFSLKEFYNAIIPRIINIIIDNYFYLNQNK